MAVITTSTASAVVAGTNVGGNPFGYDDIYSTTTNTVTLTIDLTADDYGYATYFANKVNNPQSLDFIISPSETDMNEVLKWNQSGLNMAKYILPSDGTLNTTGNLAPVCTAFSASVASYNTTWSRTYSACNWVVSGINGMVYSIMNPLYLCLSLPGSVQADLAPFFQITPTHVGLVTSGNGWAVYEFYYMPAAAKTNFRIKADPHDMHATAWGGLFFDKSNGEFLGEQNFLLSVIGAGNWAGTGAYGFPWVAPTVPWQRLAYGATGLPTSIDVTVSWYYPDGTFTTAVTTLTHTSLGACDPSSGADWYLINATFTPGSVPANAIFYRIDGSNIVNSTTLYVAGGQNPKLSPTVPKLPMHGPDGSFIPAYMPIWTKNKTY